MWVYADIGLVKYRYGYIIKSLPFVYFWCLLVFLRLNEVNEVVHGVPDVSRDVEVHQREAQALPDSPFGCRIMLIGAILSPMPLDLIDLLALDLRPPGRLPVGPLGEDVAELRVRELVDASFEAHGEVAPAVARGLEADRVDLPRSGLEALVRVLRRDAGGAAVLSR